MNPAQPDASDRLKSITPTAHNGYLLHVPGEVIAAGSATLPAPSENEKHRPERTVEVDVPHLGKMRVTYMLKKYRHYKSNYWNWLAARADLITVDEPPR